MAITDVMNQIDAEIAKLQQARALLTGGTHTPAVTGKRRGRPPGTKNPAKAVKRTMSPEGKARIAAAQKARWAKAKKAA